MHHQTMTSVATRPSPCSESARHEELSVLALHAYLIDINHTLREELLAKPYVTYLIAPKEGRALLDHLGELERLAFLTRALARERERRVDLLDASVERIMHELDAMHETLSMERCTALLDLVAALQLAIEQRRRDTLDLLIETLLDVRKTWSHAISVVARAPV